MKDVLGQAIADHYHTRSTAKLWVHHRRNDGPGIGKPIMSKGPSGSRNPMPVEIYFRSADDMPELEWVALQHCKGKILDIGAGAGSHALFLQRTGLDVTALDISPLATGIMKERGVKNIVCRDFFALKTPARYDTLLLLMNGIGLSGSLEGLRTFLRKARTYLRPGGRLLFDSCDIAYVYKRKPPKGDPYYGELLYQYEYRRQRSDWFNWLFIDRLTLRRIIKEEGWQMKLLFEDKSDQYLVECIPV